MLAVVPPMVLPRLRLILCYRRITPDGTLCRQLLWIMTTPIIFQTSLIVHSSLVRSWTLVPAFAKAEPHERSPKAYTDNRPYNNARNPGLAFR
jgi:hypothetical protein